MADGRRRELELLGAEKECACGGGGVLREGRNHGNCNMTNNVPMMCDVCNGKDTECLNKKGEICLGRILGH